MSYRLVDVADVEPAGPGGAVRFVRRKLGCEAFGINWFEIPPGMEGREPFSAIRRGSRIR